MRVLFLSPTLPWPLDAGGRIRTWQLLRSLQPTHEVHVWAVRQPGVTGADEERVREVCAALRVFERGALSFRRRLLAPKPERWFHSPAMEASLREAVASGEFELLHVDELCLARLAEELDGLPRVLHHHKLDLELARALHEAGRGSVVEVERWRRLEAEGARCFETHVFCCAEDGERFLARHPRIEYEVVGNGVDLDAYQPLDVAREPKHLLFLGSLDYAPNVIGLERFLAEVWPILRRRFPGLRLSLVGRAPTARCFEGLPADVELIGPVPDVRPWLARATALVVPLTIGGGSRLKIVEALAMKCPVATTAVGAEGLPLDGTRELLRAEGLAGLEKTLSGLLDNPGDAARRAAAGHEHVAELCGWRILARRLGEIWECTAQAPR